MMNKNKFLKGLSCSFSLLLHGHHNPILRSEEQKIYIKHGDICIYCPRL